MPEVVRKITSVGDSLAVVLPRVFVDALTGESGAEDTHVTLSLDKDAEGWFVIIRPVKNREGGGR